MPPVGAKSTIFSILQHWPGSCTARHASRQQGEWHVIHSVVGQSERWAQLTALQPPPAAQPGQGSGSGFSNVGTTPADPTVVNPIAGSTASPLSSNMSFMLMMFGGGLASATGSGAAGGTGLTSGSGSTTASPDGTSNIQGGTGAASVLANLQSLIASLTGGTSGTPATAPTGSGALSTGSSLLQDLDSIVTDLGTTTATPGGAQPPPPPPSSGAATAQPSDGIDITNQGSAAAVATWGDGPARPGGGWQEQFALAAYQSGSTSGPNSQSAWQSVSV